MDSVETLFGFKITKERLAKILQKKGITLGASGVVSLLAVLEKIGIQSLFVPNEISYSRDIEFVDVRDVVQKLRAIDFPLQIEESLQLPDEPRLFRYSVKTGGTENPAQGSSFFKRTDAYFAAIAEAVERYIWRYDEEVLGKPIVKTFSELGTTRALDPLSFQGFSPEKRSKNSRLQITKDTTFSWVQGYSLTQKKKILIPAQLVSAAYALMGQKTSDEKMIWSSITTGLATGVTASQAKVKAILESMERDALITHYYNTLTPPQLDLEDLSKQDDAIKNIVGQLKRYQLEVRVLDVSADFPTHALIAVVIDRTNTEPFYSFGMRTSFSLKVAVLDSIKEALAMRPYQRFFQSTSYPENFEDFTMLDRGNYWGKKEHASQLDFFLSGSYIQKKIETSIPSWDEQLVLLTNWFTEKNYELSITNLSNSKFNAPKWHIYIAICPQLQPMHLHEKYATVEGVRMREVPLRLGISNPKLNPIPHPFM